MARTVGILILPEFQLLTAVEPITVFDAAARNSTSPPCRLRAIAPTTGPVTSSSGAQLIAEKFSKVTLDTALSGVRRGRADAVLTHTAHQLSNFDDKCDIVLARRRACL